MATEQERNAHAVYLGADSDNDGWVTDAEWAAFLPFYNNVKGLMERQGMSWEQALAHNANAINQGGDLDGDGFVTNQEWAAFQNPQTGGAGSSGGGTTPNTNLNPTNPGYTGGGDIYQNPGDAGVIDDTADDPWWHSAAGNPVGADEIVPADILQVYDQFTKLMAESGVDLNQVVADGGIGMAAQLLENNLNSGAVDPNTLDPAIYQALGVDPGYNPVLQGLLDQGMTYQDALAHNQNALNQREGVDLDGDGYVTDEEWANWEYPASGSDDGWLDDILGSILDDDLNGWLKDLGSSSDDTFGDVMQQGEDWWEQNQDTAGDWRWYEDDEGNNVFGPPPETGNTDNIGGGTDNTGGTGGTGGTGSNDGGFNIPWEIFGGLFGGGNSDGGDGVGSFTDFLGNLFGGGGGGSANSVGLGQVLVNTAMSDYAAGKAKDALDDQLDFNKLMYQQGVNRLDPYNQLGVRNIGNAESQAKYKPTMRDLGAGNFSLNPDTNVQGPTANNMSGQVPGAYAGPQSRTDEIQATTTVGPAQAREVAVNQTNLLDPSNPYLQAMQNESRKQIEDAGVAAGKFKSGQTMEALNDSTMANYARLIPTLQNVESSRDSMNLAANNQLFNQWQTGQDFRLNRDLANIQNRMGKDAQRFGQQMAGAQFGSDQDYRNFLASLNADQQRYGQQLGAAQFGVGQQNQNFANRVLANEQQYDQKYRENAQKLFNDQQSFNQFLSLVQGVGQPSAAGQASLGNNQMYANAGAYQGMADLEGGFYAGLLKNLWGQT